MKGRDSHRLPQLPGEYPYAGDADGWWVCIAWLDYDIVATTIMPVVLFSMGMPAVDDDDPTAPVANSVWLAHHVCHETEDIAAAERELLKHAQIEHRRRTNALAVLHTPQEPQCHDEAATRLTEPESPKPHSNEPESKPSVPDSRLLTAV